MSPSPVIPPTAASPPSARPSTPTAQGRKPWAVEDLREILQGTADPRLAREADRKGLSMATYGAMSGAVTADALLPLLGLLEPPEGESRIDLVLQLLERIAESQIRIEARLAAIESRSAVRR